MGATSFGAMQFYTRRSTVEHGYLKNELSYRYHSKSIPLRRKWMGFYFRKPTVALYILLFLPAICVPCMVALLCLVTLLSGPPVPSRPHSHSSFLSTCVPAPCRVHPRQRGLAETQAETGRLEIILSTLSSSASEGKALLSHWPHGAVNTSWRVRVGC